MIDEQLKAELTATLKQLSKMERKLLSMDAEMVRQKLNEAGKAIRPMLCVLQKILLNFVHEYKTRPFNLHMR